MTRKIRFIEALREGMRQEMQRDERVFVMGEGVGPHGSCFKQTEGFYEEFGEDRVRDTPISELGFSGAAVGAALGGLRPIADLMWLDFSMLATDQICNQAAKLKYMSDGQVSVPVVYRAAVGGLPGSGAQHSGCFYSWYCHIPGLKVVIPSNAYDAKGLIISAILDDDPVVYLEHRQLFNTKAEVPEEYYSIPLGVADIKKQGEDITIVATGVMVNNSLKAAEMLEADGISAEVIDPRTLIPLDEVAVLESVNKTHRLLVVDEGFSHCGYGSEVISTVVSKAMDSLAEPPKQLTAINTTIPFSPPMDSFVYPNANKIAGAVRSMMPVSSVKVGV